MTGIDMQQLYLAIPLACLVAAAAAGLFGRFIGRAGAHWVTILAVAAAFGGSVLVYADVMAGHTFNGTVYTWGVSGGAPFELGFLIDQLSATMMVVVTFVSFMVHLYTIGYMREDPGYQRFFSYIALFTFAMLMLVMSNNFLQLFFGWEAVGLVSYLLIGFWFDRESAIFANMKAFLVNRVGDLGFLLGIGAIFAFFGTLDYAAVFSTAGQMGEMGIAVGGGMEWPLITTICLLLFVGAMGKSAQVPLHVWLPDSMEGPTPISALIHAATMVTAGIFMVARMWPLYELSPTALSVVLVIGATTALAMGLVGLVQNDIKRVVAYSTLSQLGYMTVALGVSAYSAAIFHLGTHAFFKALLFLAAGSVIIGMHHEQDMRRMGGLKTYMPVTYVTALIGSLALVGIPPFAGFFSKDLIIAAVQQSTIPGAGFALVAVTAGVFVTALYSFRLVFMTFHGRPRMDAHTRDHLHESPLVVTLPLVALAVPSIVAGWLYIDDVLVGGYFGQAVSAAPARDVVAAIAAPYAGQSGHMVAWHFLVHGLKSPALWLGVSGVITAWVLYVERPAWPALIAARFGPLYRLLERKYGFDEFYQWLFANGARALGGGLWRQGDVRVIDGWLVNGSARLVGWLSSVVRQVQSGLVYHYAFAMIIGLFLLMTWFLKV